MTVEDIAFGHYAFPTVGEGVVYAAQSALAVEAGLASSSEGGRA